MTPNSQSNLPLGNGATPLFSDTFTGTTAIENKWLVLKGSAAGTKNPGLTAGTSTTFPTVPAGGIPGFGGTPDTPAGVLRLTDNTPSQAGAVIYNQSLFARGGISIKFEYFQYGGNAVNGNKGDGISFFLLDGAASPTQAGGFGGGLGYAQNNSVGVGDGIAGGYLGIGFDAFGNFGQASEGRVGGVTGDTADRVTVRGSASTQYKYLTSTNKIGIGIDNEAIDANRGNSGRLVQIDITAAGKLTVKFDLNSNGLFDAGENVINDYDTIGTGTNSALPDTFKFGFGAASGGATNFQEIRGLSISSITDVFSGVTDANNQPLSVNYTAGATPVVLSSNLGVNTIVLPTGATTFSGATIGITPASYKIGQDFLTVGPVTNNVPATNGTFTNGLTWIFNPNAGSPVAGVLTISGAGTPAQYQDALKQVSYYNNAGGAALVTDRTAQYTLTGVAGSPSTTSIIKVAAGNTAAKRPEILFQDFSTGEAALWSVDTKGVLVGGRFLTLGASFGAASVGKRLAVPTGWKAIDTGDVDKDGIADILWFNPASQETAIHFMGNDGVIKSGDFIRTSATAKPYQVGVAEQWSPVSLTDVTGDGTLDILWRAAATDQIAYWTVAGTTGTILTSGGFLQNAGGTADFKVGDNSKAVKVGDFDGDGKATDMLFSNGKIVLIGALTGGKLLAKGAVLSLPASGDTSLVVRAVGDYNADGTTDIMWESTTADKQVVSYVRFATGALTGTTFTNLIPTGTPQAWNVGASKDFNADVTPDLVWHNTLDGKTAVWAIDKALPGGLITDGSTAVVKFGGKELITPSFWDVVGADDFGSVTFA
jgi:hypothetical protein